MTSSKQQVSNTMPAVPWQPGIVLRRPETGEPVCRTSRTPGIFEAADGSGWSLALTRKLTTPHSFTLRLYHNRTVMLAGPHRSELRITPNGLRGESRGFKTAFESGTRPTGFAEEKKKDTRTFALCIGEDSAEALAEQARQLARLSPEPCGPPDSGTLSSASPLLALASEQLRTTVRPPSGMFRTRWCATPHEKGECFRINHLYPVISALVHLDAKLAEELIECAFGLQQRDGSIPRIAWPDGRTDTAGAPWLLLLPAVETVWAATGNKEWLGRLSVHINQYIQWASRHFIQPGAALPQWRNRNETFNPERFRNGLSSAELPAMLANEIITASRIYKEADLPVPEIFSATRERIMEILDHDYFNSETGCFSTAYLNGEPVPLEGFSAYLPLIWQDMKKKQRQQLFLRFRNSPWFTNRETKVFESGEDTESGTQTPFIYLFLGLLMMEHLPGGRGHVNLYAGCIRDKLNLWHRQIMKGRRPFPTDNPLCWALIIRTEAIRQDMLENSRLLIRIMHRINRILNIDKTELLTLTFMLVGALIIHNINKDQNETPEPALFRTTISQQLRTGDFAGASRNAQAFTETYPDSKEARLTLANCLLLNRQYDQSLELFRELNEKDPDHPAGILGQALALHRAGNFKAARPRYEEFIAYFQTIYPEVAELTESILEAPEPRLSFYYLLAFLNQPFMMNAGL